MTIQNNINLIICQDLAYRGPGRMCVVLDLGEQTVTFENCFISNTFLSVSKKQTYKCSFSEITKVVDLLLGNHTGILMRVQLFLSGIDASDLRSVFVHTQHGNARIFAQWNDFERFRSTLIEECKPSRGGGYGIDNPEMWDLYAIFFVLLLAGLIWILV